MATQELGDSLKPVWERKGGAPAPLNPRGKADGIGHAHLISVLTRVNMTDLLFYVFDSAAEAASLL